VDDASSPVRRDLGLDRGRADRSGEALVVTDELAEFDQVAVGQRRPILVLN